MEAVLLVALPGVMGITLAVWWSTSRTWFIAYVEEGALIPHKWLGRAWMRYDTNHSVFLPIPFNVVGRKALNVYYRLRVPLNPTWFEEQMASVYWSGYRKGRGDHARTAYDRG